MYVLKISRASNDPLPRITCWLAARTWPFGPGSGCHCGTKRRMFSFSVQATQPAAVEDTAAPTEVGSSRGADLMHRAGSEATVHFQASKDTWSGTESHHLLGSYARLVVRVSAAQDAIPSAQLIQPYGLEGRPIVVLGLLAVTQPRRRSEP